MGKGCRTELTLFIDGYQYILTLNGGEYSNQAQSASITLECDETQKRTVSIIRCVVNVMQQKLTTCTG